MSFGQDRTCWILYSPGDCRLSFSFRQCNPSFEIDSIADCPIYALFFGHGCLLTPLSKLEHGASALDLFDNLLRQPISLFRNGYFSNPVMDYKIRV